MGTGSEVVFGVVVEGGVGVREVLVVVGGVLVRVGGAVVGMGVGG